MVYGYMNFVRAIARGKPRRATRRRQMGYAVKRYKRMTRMLGGRKGRGARAWT